MDFSLISSAMSAITGAIDLGKGALSVRDQAKVAEIVRAMNEMLLDGQQRLFEISAALHTLQQENFQTAQELRELKKSLVQRSRYTLVKIGSCNFAYRINPGPASSGASDPAFPQIDHYVCQQCLDRPGKSALVVLQCDDRFDGSRGWTCHGCGTSFIES